MRQETFFDFRKLLKLSCFFATASFVIAAPMPFRVNRQPGMGDTTVVSEHRANEQFQPCRHCTFRQSLGHTSWSLCQPFFATFLRLQQIFKDHETLNFSTESCSEKRKNSRRKRHWHLLFRVALEGVPCGLNGKFAAFFIKRKSSMAVAFCQGNQWAESNGFQDI